MSSVGWQELLTIIFFIGLLGVMALIAFAIVRMRNRPPENRPPAPPRPIERDEP